MAVGGEPQRLGQREGEDALQAGAQRALDQGAHAHGLGGEPDRLAARAAQQVGRVGVEGIEVDDGERRLQARGGGVKPGPGGLCEIPHGPGR